MTSNNVATIMRDTDNQNWCATEGDLSSIERAARREHYIHADERHKLAAQTSRGTTKSLLTLLACH